MATACLSNENVQASARDKRLEIFSVIWLDPLASSTETQDAEQKLRSFINHLKKFDDVKQCQQYIEQTSPTDRLLFVVTMALGKEIIPCIHLLRQVISIHVYCSRNFMSLSNWPKKFPKIKSVARGFDELISQIREDHRIQKKIEEPLPINIFTTNSGGGKSTTGLNGQFVFSQVLIDCLLRLKPTKRDETELINLCKNEYEGNPSELNHLREFEKEYSSNKVLWWYSRESFFYKTLNASLRTQNIHMIFLFRAFISDIRRQLQHDQTKSSLRAYRGQIMSHDELETLKQSVGQYISINSFFSTSLDHSKAVAFLDKSVISNDLEQVLFEIEANPKMVTTKPFADISKHSEFADESEVLFMMGSIFHLTSIINNSRVWIIQMTLCSDEEYDLKQVLLHIKQRIGDGETDLRKLGKVLWKMGKLDLAEEYLKRLVDELALYDPLRYYLYEDLGELASQKGDYDMSIQWHQKSVDFMKHEPDPSATPINNKLKWKKNGVTIAGGNGDGSRLDQLSIPFGIYVSDEEQSIYIADCGNHRVVQWNFDAKNGQVVARGNEKGDRMGQLNYPTDITIDKTSDSLVICDQENKRVVRWSRQSGGIGQTVISRVNCRALAMDGNGSLYVSDWKKNEVRRWKIDETDTDGTIVAGGNGQGSRLNQFNCPTYIFVDEYCTVFVSDSNNNRVMKWIKDAKEGIVVAGGNGYGDSLNQLSNPLGLSVDHLGNVYVADSDNQRVVRWSKGCREGVIIVGGNGKGKRSDQFNGLRGLSFDQQSNIYVVDYYNHRVQKFHTISN